MKWLFFLLIVYICCVSPVFSETPNQLISIPTDVGIREIEFFENKLWTVEDGIYQWDIGDMSKKKIENMKPSEMTVDQEGNLWICKDNYNIYKWDGIQWELMRQHDPDGDYDYGSWLTIQDSTFDLEGRLWYSTAVFPLYYDSVEKALDIPTIPKNMSESSGSIYVTKSGDIWAHFYENGVWKYDGSTWLNMGLKDVYLGFDSIEEFNNDIWLGSHDGLYRYHEKQWEKYDVGNENQDVLVCSLSSDDNYLWIGTTKGIFRYNGESIVKIIEYSVSPPDQTTDVIQVKAISNETIIFANSLGIHKYNYDIAESTILTSSVSSLTILKNHPNPFNPVTTISFNLQEHGFVKLSIYSISGQKIRTLISEHLSAGNNRTIWNSYDEDGNAVSSGTYILYLTTGLQTVSRKILLIR
ncbi:T9SS type A sorting domain-containing protein [Candidatus Omnitrophota bacterium]